MSHPLIASLGVACLLGVLPLPAHAAEDAQFPASNPLLSHDIAQHGFKLLRVKTGAARSSATRMMPVIYGPDFMPKWRTKALSPDTGASKLEGDQFKFR